VPRWFRLHVVDGEQEPETISRAKEDLLIRLVNGFVDGQKMYGVGRVQSFDFMVVSLGRFFPPTMQLTDKPAAMRVRHGTGKGIDDDFVSLGNAPLWVGNAIQSFRPRHKRTLYRLGGGRMRLSGV